MANLIYRTDTPSVPGSTSTKPGGLTNSEIDGNFKSLNDGKVEIADCVSTATANKIVKRDESGAFAASVITCTDLNSTSDRRLKENIYPIENALELVNQLEGVRFNFISNPSESKIGLIAQDVQQVLPEVIGKVIENNEETLTVGYQNIVAVLIQAVKELSEKVNRLEVNNV
jgi:hypothetical protein